MQVGGPVAERLTQQQVDGALRRKPVVVVEEDRDRLSELAKLVAQQTGEAVGVGIP